MELPTWLHGSWSCDLRRSDDNNAMLEEMGVSWLARKMVANVAVSWVLSPETGGFTQVTTSGGRVTTARYVFGAASRNETPLGTSVLTASVEGPVLILAGTAPKGQALRSTFEPVAGEASAVLMTTTIARAGGKGDLVLRRIFVRAA